MASKPRSVSKKWNCVGCVSGRLTTSSGGQWALMGYSIKQQTALEAPSAQELTQITLSCFLNATPSQQGHEPLLALDPGSFQFPLISA